MPQVPHEGGDLGPFLAWYPGHVDTRMNTYTVMTIAAVCRGFTLACVFI